MIPPQVEPMENGLLGGLHPSTRLEHQSVTRGRGCITLLEALRATGHISVVGAQDAT